jgi:hypothetical protein
MKPNGNIMANKSTKTVKIHAYNADVDAIFEPMVQNMLSTTDHNAFCVMLMKQHPKPVSFADVLAWQLKNPKYAPSTQNREKRAKNNISSHVQNVNNPTKRVTFTDVGMRVIKSIDGYKLIPIE